MKYLVVTKESCLTFNAEKISCQKWYVDAAFAVHSDFKSHTGAILSMGEVAIVSVSRNQKLNTKIILYQEHKMLPYYRKMVKRVQLKGQDI